MLHLHLMMCYQEEKNCKECGEIFCYWRNTRENDVYRISTLISRASSNASLWTSFGVSLITISNWFVPTFVSLFVLVLANEITLFTVHALNPGVFLIFVCFYFSHNCGNLSILPIIWCCVSFQFNADCVFPPTLVTRKQHFQW